MDCPGLFPEVSPMPYSEPDVLPLLSRGRHRNPRRGACFMELVAFLAGEPWSDHPACTHPLLAELARRVNDHTSDPGRPRLATLVPSVIGLSSDDVRWDHEIALLTATSVLPVVTPDRRGPLAVGVLTCERLLAAAEVPPVTAHATAGALRRFPIAAEWARDFLARAGNGRLTDHPGPALVAYAVRGVADSGRSDTDEILEDLLTDAVELCRGLAGRSAAPALDPDAWREVCRPAVVPA